MLKRHRAHHTQNAAFTAYAAAGLPSGYPSVSMRATNGTIQMPLIGLGTWEYNDTVAQAAVTGAFSVGYRYHPTSHLNLTSTTTVLAPLIQSNTCPPVIAIWCSRSLTWFQQFCVSADTWTRRSGTGTSVVSAELLQLLGFLEQNTS